MPSVRLTLTEAAATAATALVLPSASASSLTCVSWLTPGATVGAGGVEPSHVALWPGQGVWFAGVVSEPVRWEGRARADRVLTTIPPPRSAPTR